MRAVLTCALLIGGLLIAPTGVAFFQNVVPGRALPPWPRVTPREAGLEERRLIQARDYALQGGGSGVVIHRGKLVFSWGDVTAKYDLKSTTKSIGATMLGVALQDGRVKLTDP